MIKILLIASFCWTAIAADSIAFEGTPTVRVDTDGNESKRTELSDEGAAKYECRIVKKGRGYIWASRDDRELKRVNAGDYTYFISPEGSGYVKVYVGSSPQSHEYLEHLTTELKTITYWGKRRTLQLTSKD